MEPTDVGGCIPALAGLCRGAVALSRGGRGGAAWCGAWSSRASSGAGRAAAAWLARGGGAGAAEQGRDQFGEWLAGAGAGDLLRGADGLRRRGVVGACWPGGVARGRAAGEVERVGGLEREARHRVERAGGVWGDEMREGAAMLRALTCTRWGWAGFSRYAGFSRSDGQL
jgi:hypothetical protein